MVYVNVLTIISVILMGAWLLNLVINIIIKERADKITFIRNYKKGKGFLIYLFVLPLYWASAKFGGLTLVRTFFEGIKKSFDLVFLKFDFDNFQPLMNANKLFSAAVYICFVFVALNAFLFILSVANQYMWSFYKRMAFSLSKKEKLVIFGNNPNSLLIYKSDKKRVKMLVDKLSDSDALSLYMHNVAYTSVRSVTERARFIVSRCLKGSRLTVVINTQNENANINLGQAFNEAIKLISEEDRKKCFGTLSVFLFGDPRYEAIYEDIVANSYGCISYVNKYQKIAMSFVDEYPFTRFLTSDQIDYTTSLVKKDVNINAFMIGFGKTNQQIFLTSVANNQFIQAGAGGAAELKKVDYYIFDKKDAENDKNLNHNYHRFKNELPKMQEKESDYLPLPSMPAQEHFRKLDINDPQFYNDISVVAKRSKIDMNFAIIAFGTDLENIDMAKKLLTKRREWGVSNFVIFVKVRGKYSGLCFSKEDNCFLIANEAESVYNIDMITQDRIFKMAQIRNEIYDMEYAITHENYGKLSPETAMDIVYKAQRNWYIKKTQFERDSNLYGCLSLRSKLNMMGLDCVPASYAGAPALTQEEYLKVYAGDDIPDTSFYPFKINGKAIVHYTLEFNSSRRTNLAVLEHFRWNSYMISQGFIPSTLEQIKSEKIETDGKKVYSNGRNYSVRRHGNLTTFEGLTEYRKILAKRDAEDKAEEKREEENIILSAEDKAKLIEECEKKRDVIKYDYQLLDDAYWLLDRVGYKIVRINKN